MKSIVIFRLLLQLIKPSNLPKRAIFIKFLEVVFVEWYIAINEIVKKK